MGSEILSVKEKIDHGMGDVASRIIFDNVMLYMMFFYTDIFGIPTGFVDTMSLLAHALDAISDPCMGLLADHTRPRWEKFRPWVLFDILSSGPVYVLAYNTPDPSLCGKMIYAVITYTLLTLLYTMVNIPYCALGSVITNDPMQRISLQSWHFTLVTAGGMSSTMLMMPLVSLIGGEDKALDFQGGIVMLSVMAFLMLVFCFFTTREHVEAPPSSNSMREDLRDIWQNDQRHIIGLLTVLNILAVCVRSGTIIYCVIWILGTPEVFVAFLTTCCVDNLIGSVLIKPLTDWKYKASVFWQANVLLAVISLAMFFVPMHANLTMSAFIFVIGVLHQLVMPIQWVTTSDTVNYGEWYNGKYLTGISFTGALFVLKLGLALGEAIISWMLVGDGYDTATKTQNSATINIIITLFAIALAICYLLSAMIAKRLYTLKTPYLTGIMSQLAQGTHRSQQDFSTKRLQD